MRSKNELMPKDLKDICNENIFKFETTKDVEDTSDLIYGQERALKALEFGVDIDFTGYNLYIEGPSGTGKTMYTKNYLEERASKSKVVPDDWCYIYNFENPNEPIAVSFPAGQGKVFKDTMESFVKDIRRDIKKTFNNDDFEKEKQIIKSEYEKKREALMEKLNKRTMVQGFQVQATSNGIYMMPVLDGKTLAEIKAIEKEAEKRIDEWQSNVALMTINVHINSIKANYKKNKKILDYLENVKKDILKNISQFLADDGVKYRNVPRPENLERMIEIAEKIAQGFPQVRVDLYNVRGKIYFGEMTFFAFSGMNNHFTMKFQRMIGEKIQLP